MSDLVMPDLHTLIAKRDALTVKLRSVCEQIRQAKAATSTNRRGYGHSSNAYQRDYMRKRRAAQKWAKLKEAKA